MTCSHYESSHQEEAKGRLSSHAPNVVPCPEISFNKCKCPVCLAVESKFNNQQWYEFSRCLILLANWLFLIWIQLRCKECSEAELSYWGISKVYSRFVLSYRTVILKLIPSLKDAECMGLLAEGRLQKGKKHVARWRWNNWLTISNQVRIFGKTEASN